MKKTLLLFLSLLASAASFATIYGPLHLCTSAQAYYHGDSLAAPTGTWSSSNTAVATTGTVSAATGLITAVAPGTAIISYTTSGGTSTAVVTVDSAISDTGAITGPLTVFTGTTVYLANFTGPVGSWASGSASIASVEWNYMGQEIAVRGINPGTAIISYGVLGCLSSATATRTITVVPGTDCIGGRINFPPGTPNFQTRVWLIKYNPATHLLYAADSMTGPSYSDTMRYQFCSVGADSFRIKAAVVPWTYSTVLPTYHTASAYWNTAAVVNHAAGTSDVNIDINMLPGTPTTGAGFISGDVTTGANKGTADPIPARHLQIFCKDQATGNILKYTYTDDMGAYSFSNLPVGQTYTIYPEEPGYTTTPFSSISLTSSSASMTAARFVKHTLSHTITPGEASVTYTQQEKVYAQVFPNPASDVLYLHLGGIATGKVAVTMTDITGRTVLASSIDANGADVSAPVDVSTVSKGFYLLSVKAGNLNYNTKVEIK